MHPCPFTKIAEKVGIDTETLLTKIREYQEKGLIRRSGAVLNHTRFKVTSTNAMGVWEVPETEIEKMRKIASKYKQISHCYQRKTHSEWRYNFYTMIHARSLKECKRVIQEIVKQSGVRSCKLLITLKEYKKSIPRYF